ncbi:Hypothetical predicted protein [Paramuricea clavata]|uniref:Uncharacterized protein n=1 Tax=Paramuricea clavata TaxID=317549 RepID=A0A6S7ITD5_PARCT|nr:Hypothetical predicted protein [Paramuricea clavata]
MLDASKVSTGGHSDKAIDDVLTADCSTLDELEDFIDRSFQNANILMQNNNTNISSAQSFDSSTPVRTQDEAKLGITVNQFRMFKDKIESDIVVLINNLSEQTQIINKINHAQNILESEPTPISRPANQVDAASQVCLDIIGNNSNYLSNCRCSCGVLAADVEEVKLDITTLSNRIDSIANANTEYSHKDKEIDRLRSELSIEKARSEKLESELSLFVKERSLEIEKLNLTIVSLENKNASTFAAPMNNNNNKINKNTLMNKNNRNGHRNNGHRNNNELNQCKSQNVSLQPFIPAPVNNRDIESVPSHDTNRDLQNKALQINQIANMPEKQPISDWIGSLPLIDIPIQAKITNILMEIPRTSLLFPSAIE